MVIHRYRHLEVSKWKSCSALGFSQASSPVSKPYPRTQIFQWPLSYGVNWWMLSTQESQTKRNSSRKNFDGKIDTSWRRRILQFSSVQKLSCVWLFANPWTAAIQASLSITNSHSPPKPMSIELVMPSSHLILYCPLLLLPSVFPTIKVFSNESALHTGGQSIGVSALSTVLPMNTQDWSPLEWTGWISLQSKGLSRVFSNTTVQKHQFFGAQLSLQSNSHIHTWPLEKP